ncbi:MAG: hypothetical protein K6G30_05220 [Acetatifactor sp.]|nr:hypothetical protein [Acetatifactor sp.]
MGGKKVTAYGMVMTEEEYHQRYGSLIKIAEYAKKYGFEVIEGETAFSVGFIVQIMDRMEEEIQKNK